MFKTILIANRGEIACRIMRSANALGITTIAIYAAVDRMSLHVRMADHAFEVPVQNPIQAYLAIEPIIAIAQQSGAEAIHPGYGFLSENADFARACQQAGLIWIGPSIHSLQIMGSKKHAKQLLETTQVPLIPGYHGTAQDQHALCLAAQQIGLPVLLKAAAGGGGKGMRIVAQVEQLPVAIDAVKREAQAYFNDSTIIIEKLIENPRHIEVQIMADEHGNIVHLFDRDCSTQRRHQKIIEEAPAPNLSHKLRADLTLAACEVAHAINYIGAGTIEFLVTANQDKFYFMEMNTRLQVENPVTESITQLDLVEWQLRIANHEKLPLEQASIVQNGHAIECRIYAEDPEQDFRPSSGYVHYLRQPSKPYIRIDTGVEEGALISIYYDPMIAKLIVWGVDREQCLVRVQQALAQYAIGGVRTNLYFLQNILQHTQFIQAKISTDFLNHTQIIIHKHTEDDALHCAAIYDYLRWQETKDALQRASFGWQSQQQMAWPVYYAINQQEYVIHVTPIDGNSVMLRTIQANVRFYIQQNDEWMRITNASSQQTIDVRIIEWQSVIECHFIADKIDVQRVTIDALVTNALDEQNTLIAPMPATVVAVFRQEGDTVQKGDALLVIEAMKMEQTIVSPKDGKIKTMFFQIGNQVHEGAALVELYD